jgi:hypothetical protein
MSFKKIALIAAFAAPALALSGAANALTLNTAGLKADSVLTFSVAASGASAAATVVFQPLGNMTSLPGVAKEDPETGDTVLVESFNQPVTKADIKVTSSLAIVPTSGAAARSGLKLIRGKVYVGLANFVVNFDKKIVYADIITPTATLTQAELYTFKDNGDLKISLKGLVLNQSQSVSNLVFTDAAQKAIADGLSLSSALRAVLPGLDWGTIAVKVTSYKRSPAVSTTPLTAADFAK